MIWYQKFEYAASHWLQKSTEHVYGCCLCSPGCFSLFRGSALDEVLDTYTKKPKKALHHIQYDLGIPASLPTHNVYEKMSIKFINEKNYFIVDVFIIYFIYQLF